MKIIKYIAMGCVAFVFFVYLTFPYGQLTQWIEMQAATALGSPWSLAIGELSPKWLSVGVEAEGIELRRVAAGESRAKAVVTVDELALSTSLLGAATGSYALDADAIIGDGEINVGVQYAEGNKDVSVNFDELGLEDLRVIAELSGLRLGGRIDGSIDATQTGADVKGLNADVNLDFNAWQIMKGSKIVLGAMGEINFADLNLGAVPLSSEDGTSGVTATIAEGVVDIARLRLAGGDLGLELSGKVYLDAKPSNSRVNLKGKLMVSDSLKKALPMISILGQASPDDGSYALSLSGRASRLKKRIGSMSL